MILLPEPNETRERGMKQKMYVIFSAGQYQSTEKGYK